MTSSDTQLTHALARARYGPDLVLIYVVTVHEIGFYQDLGI
jgi:hypothetical protein